MIQVREDPLIGKIYRSVDQKEISYADLREKIVAADVVYLGENHDNEFHHQHQLQIIEDMIEQGRKPRIGFEFFSVDQSGYLMLYVSQNQSKRPGRSKKNQEMRLRHNLGWQNRTDEAWRFYFRFVQLAVEHNLTVFGADLPAGIVRRFTRNGMDTLNAVEKTFLKSSGLKDEAYRQLMLGKFKQAHCGFSHGKMAEKMYHTWLERNDAMADSVVRIFEENPAEPVVVILGKGHVEHNMGVYDRVRYRNQGINQLNLGFTEITIQTTALENYFPTETSADRTFQPLHDYIWFTQRASYEDPCQKFKEMLKQMKR